ncbi:MAG TPA: GNAT family N-acetyltransferase [Acidimicrobiales bacterium]|nr:GNAT family N-acetyltransferase [Acidimicrobiales bacterium]
MLVKVCGPDEVLGLRQAVLRPHQRPDEVRFPDDEGPGTAHFCAQDDDGQVLGVVSVMRQRPPWRPDLDAWRLRGMATAPEWRGTGVGSALLGAVFDHVADEGGGLLWCNARLAAVGFYERSGMVTTGDVWEEPVIGPHIAMFVQVSPPGSR